MPFVYYKYHIFMINLSVNYHKYHMFNANTLVRLAIQCNSLQSTWWFGASPSRLHFEHKENLAQPVVFLCGCRLQCPVKTCTTLFNWGLLRLRRRIVIVSREDVQPTDSFILKQSFRLFRINFHLSVDQSFTVLTQLAYEVAIKGSGPCISDLDPDLAR